MNYHTPKHILEQLGALVEPPVADDPLAVRGCTEPTAAYGETRGVAPLEEGLAAGKFDVFDEQEIRERIEMLDRTNGWLTDRIDADWRFLLDQARRGSCWSQCVVGGLSAIDARDGRETIRRYSGASLQTIIKRRDQGGWPIEAAEEIAKNGVCYWDSWPDCTCRGKYCQGPRRGCPAGDTSRIAPTRDEAALVKLRSFYELPRQDTLATASLLTQLIPVPSGWVDTGAWCDGHAMLLTRVVILPSGRLGFLPENSWAEYKRRLIVDRPPLGGIALVSYTRAAA